MARLPWLAILALALGLWLGTMNCPPDEAPGRAETLSGGSWEATRKRPPAIGRNSNHTLIAGPEGLK